MQFGVKTDFLCQSLQQDELLKIFIKHHGENVPPIHSPAVHHAAHTGPKKIFHAAEIFNSLREIVHADHPATGFSAPFLVGRRRGASKVGHQVPALGKSTRRNFVLRMEQKDLHP